MLDNEITPPKFDASVAFIAGLMCLAFSVGLVTHREPLAAALVATAGAGNLFHARKMWMRPPAIPAKGRFSLRSLMILVTTVAVALGMISYALRK